MKSKALIDAFTVYTTFVALPTATEADKVAVLFGTDEFKLDYQKKAVKLPDIGWLSCPTLEQQRGVDWVAVVQDDGDDWLVVLGAGSPYVPSAASLLPTKEGCILAMPYATQKNLTLA